MPSAKTISITVPAELVDKAEKIAAREERTLSELAADALRRYVTTDPEWQALLLRTRAQGHALGVVSEADVERLSDEFRRERLERTA